MRTSERGFSLIELMIATVITAVVMGVAFGTFRDALALNDAVVQVSDSSQNLRAGTMQATRATSVRTMVTAAITIGSVPLTP